MIEKISDHLRKDEVIQKFVDVLGDVAPGYIARIINYLSNDKKLQKCTPESIENAFLVAAATGLNFDPWVKHCYFGIGTEGRIKVATFELTYRGIYELAVRTEKYRIINCIEIVEGELLGYNRLTEEISIETIADNDQRNQKQIIAYVAYFELNSGLRKTLMMSVKELREHGQKYSDDYAKKWGGGEGEKFHEMALKTPMKLLLDKFGHKSTEMVKAIRLDQARINPDGTPAYVDNQRNKPESIEDIYAEVVELFSELEKRIPSDKYLRWQMIIEEKETPSYETLRTELLILKSK